MKFISIAKESPAPFGGIYTGELCPICGEVHLVVSRKTVTVPSDHVVPLANTAKCNNINSDPA